MPDEPKHDPATLAAASLGRDLLNAMVEELKHTALWDKMPEASQHLALRRMRSTVKQLVQRTMRAVFAGVYPAVPATLDGLSVRGEISARIKVPKAAPNRHQLIDSVGTTVMIVIADMEGFTQNMERIQAQADQPDLFADTELPDLGIKDDDEQAGEPASSEEPPEPEPENDPDYDEANWHVESYGTERNAVTNATRASHNALREQLVDALTTYNMDPAHESVNFTDDALRAATRQNLLMALAWIDAYAVDHKTSAPCPDILQPPRKP